MRCPATPCVKDFTSQPCVRPFYLYRKPTKRIRIQDYRIHVSILRLRGIVWWALSYCVLPPPRSLLFHSHSYSKSRANASTRSRPTPLRFLILFLRLASRTIFLDAPSFHPSSYACQHQHYRHFLERSFDVRYAPTSPFLPPNISASSCRVAPEDALT